MPRTTLALLLALASAPARAQGPTGPPPDARPPAAAPERPPGTSPGTPAARPEARKEVLPRGAVLEEVSGVVREVDRKAHRIAIDAGDQRVTLSLDRNTLVYTAAGLGTVLDVVPGTQVRAGRNAEFLAYWVQVRVPAGKTAPASTPGQGTGSAGGAAAPATETAAPTGAAGASPVTPGTGASPANARAVADGS